MRKKILILFVAILALQSFSYRIHSIQRKWKHPSEYIIADQFRNSTVTRTSTTLMLNLQSRTVKLINVPDVMQATEYTCGPSSLSAVLNYYQLVYRQAELAERAKTDEDYGTGPKNLANAARELNISVELKENMTLTALQNLLSLGRPVIVQIQAWSDDEHPDYQHDFDDGHYVVAIGHDSTYLYFEDPWILGSIGYIAKNQFVSRWHDFVHSENRKVFNIGIIINAPKKQTQVLIRLQ